MSDTLPQFSFDRVVQAVNAVKRRLIRATCALESAGIQCALTDDNAVAAWVATMDEAAVRNTPDVTILIERADFISVIAAMASAGFIQHTALDKHLFVDRATDRRGVQFFFATEPVLPTTDVLHPGLSESELVGSLRAVSIPALVKTKLGTFRDLDKVNLRDLIDVGLLDQTWPARYPPDLAARLQSLLDTPGG